MIDLTTRVLQLQVKEGKQLVAQAAKIINVLREELKHAQQGQKDAEALLNDLHSIMYFNPANRTLEITERDMHASIKLSRWMLDKLGETLERGKDDQGNDDTGKDNIIRLHGDAPKAQEGSD